MRNRSAPDEPLVASVDTPIRAILMRIQHFWKLEMVTLTAQKLDHPRTIF